jgi:DNA-binding transcriptional regulator YiaG
MAQQTAVEQLINYMKENFHLTEKSLQKFDEAKQMEKEQTIKFTNRYIDDDEELTALEYYFKIYGK